MQCLAVKTTKIFAGTWGGGVYFSTNNGTNWTQVNNGLPNTTVLSLTVSGSNIFAGTDSGVFLSTNNGSNWAQVNNGLTNSCVFSFAVDGNNIFAGTYGGGVFLSTNNGSNWTQVGLSSITVYSLAASGTDIFAGTWGTEVWKRPFSELVGVSKERKDLSQEFTLFQNYPNPFNPSTVISYSLPSASNVKLIVYNSLGQTVKTLENGFKNAGNYSIKFNAADLPSGIYFYKIEAGQFSQIKKMILIK